MWKNRWRICLKESDVSRPFLSLMIYATLILHNICIAFKVAGYVPAPGESMHEGVIKEVMKKFPQDMCRRCKARNKLHCRHKNRSTTQAGSSTTTMLQRRDEIADLLWEAYFHEHNAYPNVDDDDDSDND